MQKSRRKKCKGCGECISKKVKLRRLDEHDLRSLKSSLKSKVKHGDMICGKCYGDKDDPLLDSILKVMEPNIIPSTPTASSGTTGEEPLEKKIKLDLSRTTSSSTRCIVCSAYREIGSNVTFKCLQPKNWAKIFVKTGIIVNRGALICSDHFNGDALSEESYLKITASSNCFSATSECTKELLNEVRKIALHGSHTLNFDDSTAMRDEDYIRLTGIWKLQFDEVLSHLSTVRSTSVRSSRTALALLLVKLRIGLSLTVISTLFGIGKKSCNKAIHSARAALMTSFVPKHLCLAHINRNEVISNHTTTFANVLFGDSKSDVAIAVADGTYIYIEKSGNYSFQRRFYSVHKGKPFLKPMMLVATDGYILTALGPYLVDGKNSDAKITEQMLNSNVEDITDWFEEDDVMVVDRGFRDAVDILKDFGINAQMPHFLNKPQKQHTSEEANESRLVTKVRWVVESVNGRIKKWKVLSNILPNSQIPYVGDYVRIVCSLCNAFRHPLVTNTDSDKVIARRMMALAKSPNKLQDKVMKSGWDKKTGNMEKD